MVETQPPKLLASCSTFGENCSSFPTSLSAPPPPSDDSFVKPVLLLCRDVTKSEDQPKILIKVTQTTKSTQTEFSEFVHRDNIFSPEREKHSCCQFWLFFQKKKKKEKQIATNTAPSNLPHTEGHGTNTNLMLLSWLMFLFKQDHW